MSEVRGVNGPGSGSNRFLGITPREQHRENVHERVSYANENRKLRGDAKGKSNEQATNWWLGIKSDCRG